MIYFLAFRVFYLSKMIFLWIEILGGQPKGIFDMLTMTQCILCFTWDLVGSSRAITCSVMAYCMSVTCSWSVICSVMTYCVSLESMT